MGAEIVDRFGPPPPEVGLLMSLVQIKALCRRANVEKLDAGAKGLTLAFRNKSFANPTALVKWVAAQGDRAYVRPDMRIVVDDDFDEARGPAHRDAQGHAGDRQDRGEEGVAGQVRNWRIFPFMGNSYIAPGATGFAIASMSSHSARRRCICFVTLAAFKAGARRSRSASNCERWTVPPSFW